jgi:hypothetical protein
MKTTRSLLTGILFASLVALDAAAQGMPPEAQENIHRLFDQHAAVRRTVTLTDQGYTALTESDDPVMAKTLRAHVSQMRERLESGLAVRRWDPAYAEMVQHYRDLELTVEPTANGLRIVMVGKTPAAVKIAQNHAGIVSKFVEKGWAEHDVSHAAVASAAVTPEPPAKSGEGHDTKGASCGSGCGSGCGAGAGESGGKPACCRAPAATK